VAWYRAYIEELEGALIAANAKADLCDRMAAILRQCTFTAVRLGMPQMWENCSSVVMDYDALNNAKERVMGEKVELRATARKEASGWPVEAVAALREEMEHPSAPSLVEALRVVQEVVPPNGISIYPEYIAYKNVHLSREQAAEKLTELAKAKPVTREEAAKAVEVLEGGDLASERAALETLRRYFAQKGQDDEARHNQ
jgi:hypothetical protein